MHTYSEYPKTERQKRENAEICTIFFSKNSDFGHIHTTLTSENRTNQSWDEKQDSFIYAICIHKIFLYLNGLD